MGFLTHCFYLMSVLFMFHEMIWITTTKKQVERQRKSKEITSEASGKKWAELSDEYKENLFMNLTGMMFLVWCMVGMIGAQFIGFLCLLGWTVLVTAITKPIREYGIYTSMHWINSILMFCAIAFLLINHYHLGIELNPF